MRALALCSSLLLMLAAPRPAPPNEPFIVAVVQQTGLMIPVAQFDGVAWVNKWPEGPPDARVTTLAAIPQAWTGGLPFPTSWTLWPNAGGTRTVSLRGGTIVDATCGSVWAVPTDYPPVPRGRYDGCPIPIVGAAFSTGRPLLAMPKIDGQLVPMSGVAKSFEALETTSIEQEVAGVSSPDYKGHVGKDVVDMIDRSLAASRMPFQGHPLNRAEREKEPIKVEVAYRGTFDGVSLTYVEAHREYPRPSTWNDAGCNSVSAWRGWLRVDARGVTTILSPTLSLTDCDRKEDEFVQPLGVVVTNDVPHVIAILGGWESQDVGIIGVTPTEARLVVRGRAR
jgi:hypothetical protein